jgi:hypothetical protein
MNLDQYTNVIKAVTWLLLLFFVAIVYKDCTKKQTNIQPKSTLIQTNEIKAEILKLDSVTYRIPYAYSDSERTNFLRNYSKFR